MHIKQYYNSKCFISWKSDFDMACMVERTTLPIWHTPFPQPPFCGYSYDFTVCHKHSKIGEMAAGTSGVGLVSLDQPTALCGPVTHHGALRVVPERAVGVEVVLVLYGNKYTCSSQRYGW